MAKAKQRKVRKGVVAALVVRLTADTEGLEEALGRVLEKLNDVTAAADVAAAALRCAADAWPK